MALSSGSPGRTTPFGSPFRSVRHALRLLETVASHPDGISEEDLARRSGVPAIRLAPLLAMLRRDGYLTRLDDGAWAAGQALTELGAGGEEGRRRVREEKLQQALDALRDSLGAAVYFGRYVDGEACVTGVSATADAPMVHEWVDFRAAAHATALGKCLLSQLDHDGRRDHLSRHKAARLTSRTITDPRVLLNALDRQPASVPVLDIQEYAIGTLCAAVPLTAGSTVGCLALSLPLGQAHRLRQAAEALNQQAAPALLSLTL
ncbi:IclR family transcriptional regulator [Streptomyces sp. 7-21]|uniref:IclR family transcriptional regulator n=1 Tax=Streptomyces sp. 7-21 TaxID=2802283 RepID=UPI00191D89CA|nr:IclR family transcriptional regulator C-terminal domain-containing protein [Streptomyces sp. 7-21]MBL1068451.1 IclR family transcriptional regulator [Streptomyces sp. 7-21]